MKKIVQLILNITCRFIIFSCAHVYWYQTNTPKICYKKYLGPDWIADYDDSRCTIMNNHSCFLDPWVHALYRIPCVIMKEKDILTVLKPAISMFEVLVIGADKG